MEGVKVVSDHRVYFRSDFDFRLHLKDCRGEDIGWPDCDWVATFRTRRSPFPVVASVRGGVAENCWNDGGVIHVVADGHRLLPGVLEMEFVALVPDESYPDGRRSVGAVCALDIELTRESDLCVEDVEVEAMLPCLKGDPLRYEDLTDEQRRDLMAPVMEMLAEELSPVLGERTSVESDEEFEARTGFTREDMKKDLFDDLFRVAAGSYGKVDHSHMDEDGRSTPYYLNGLWLTYEEAVDVYVAWVKTLDFGAYQNRLILTNLPFCNGSEQSVHNVDVYRLFSNSSIEVANLMGYDSLSIPHINKSGMMFYNCNKLQLVLGKISIVTSTNNDFMRCWSLKEIKIASSSNLWFADSPNLSIGSISYMVYNAKNTTAITITVHPDVYAKLTDENNAEWYQVLMDAAERNIQFATV